MIDEFDIVDGHAHTFCSYEVAKKIIEAFNKIYDIKFINPGTGDIEDVLCNMKKENIDYTVMANFASARMLHDNNLWCLEVAREHTNLIPLVSFHPGMEGDMGKLFELYVNKGAKGIKIHPMAQGFDVGQKEMDPVYRSCSDTGLPIVFHCGRVSNARINEYADIEMLMPVIERYPSIPFILTHMVDGNVEDVLFLAKNYNNVYFDTSIVITGYPSLIDTNEPSWLEDSLVIDVINAVGAERVVFGSDYPWGSPGHDLRRLIQMDLSKEQKKGILSENAKKLYKIA